jgi:hypothetical protein
VLKSACLPWKTVTLLKSRSMVCCLSTEDNWSHFLPWNDNSWTLPGIDKEFTFCKLTNKTAGFSKMGLQRIEQIQQCRCLASSLVVVLFLQNCGTLDPRIYRHRISIFGGFWRRTFTKTTHTHEVKSECMHRWTRWTFPTLYEILFFVFWFKYNLFLTNRTCFCNGLRDFSITL